MELWRRIVLVTCIGAGIGMAYLACLDPVVIIRPYDKESKKAFLRSYSTLLPGGDDLTKPLLTQEQSVAVEKIRQPRILKVEGEGWADFFQKVTAVLDGREREEWTHRLPGGSHPMKALFFRPREYPLNTLPVTFTKKSERVYLLRDRGGKPEYLEADYRMYSDGDFRLGSGFSQYPKPPAGFLFPFRQAGLFTILAGWAFYLFLPGKRRHPGSLSYDRWRVILSDILGVVFLLFGSATPILVVGGTVQAFTEGWPLFLFFSPFFVGGLLVLWVSAWYASYQILAGEEGLAIATIHGEGLYRYGDMSFFQPVVFAPPRWLIIASWIAVFASAGAARFGAAGRALLLSSSFAGSMGISLKNGSMLFITVTDQMGTTSLKGFEGVVETLRRKGVRERLEVKTVRSLGLETLRSGGASIIDQESPVYEIAVIFPLIN